MQKTLKQRYFLNQLNVAIIGLNYCIDGTLLYSSTPSCKRKIWHIPPFPTTSVVKIVLTKQLMAAVTLLHVCIWPHGRLAACTPPQYTKFGKKSLFKLAVYILSCLIEVFFPCSYWWKELHFLTGMETRQLFCRTFVTLKKIKRSFTLLKME